MSKKIVKILAIVLVVMVFATALTALTACDNTTKAKGENVVQISYTMAGFGSDWIEEAVEAFNEAYKDKGYSASLDRCDALFSSEKVIQEIKSYQDNNFDLYITISSNIVTQLMDISYSVLKERNVGILEDMNDLYASAPIAVDGSEESGTVESTRNSNLLFYNKYYSDNEAFNENYYSYQWTSAYSGMAINTAVLSQLGYDHAPRTTYEMKTMCDAILSSNAKASTNNKIYPLTWAGQNAAGYVAYSLYTWMAQYMGKDGYNNFFAMIPETGTTINNGYDVYNNEGILYALKAMNTFIDDKYACDGTVTTISHLMSEQILADGEALFCFTGDWCYNELASLNYTDEELSCIEMMAVPVLSEIADLIGLQGSEAAKDAVLCDIVKGIDEGKSDSEVASSIRLQTVTADMVAKVREARGMYYDLGTTHSAIIPSYSNAKGAAKEFLRFISSKNFCNTIYGTYAHGLTPNVNASVTGTNYLTSLSTICKKPYSTPIGEADILSKIRMNGGITFTFEPMPSYPDMAKGMAVGATGYSAQDIYDKVKNGMRDSWAVIIATAGLDE